MRTRPPGPLVRRGRVVGELGGIRTLVRRVAADVPRLRTSSAGCGQRESSPPFLLGTQVCVHQHFDRDVLGARRRGIEPRPTDLESVWAPCPPAYASASYGNRTRRPEIDNLLAYPAASRGKLARSCVKARSPAATEVALVDRSFEPSRKTFLGASGWSRTNTSGTSDRRFHPVSFRCVAPRAGIDPAPSL